MKYRLILALMLFGMTALVPYAGAVSKKLQSAKLEREGKRLYAAQQYKPAITAFLKALELREKPTLFFNLAQCYRLSGQKSEALHYYKKFRPFIKGLKKLPIKKRLLLLEEVTMRIEKLSKALAEEKRLKEAARKKREAEAKKAKIDTDPLKQDPAPHKDGTKDDALTSQWWFWTGVGSTLLFASGTAFFGVKAISANDDWEKSGDTSLRDDALLYQDLADISLAGALISGITTAVLSYLHLSRKPTSEPPAKKVGVLFNCHSRFCGINFALTF